MIDIRYGSAVGRAVDLVDSDVLAELIIEASSLFDTDRCKAKSCIERAANLVRGTAAADAPLARAGAPAPGGLSGWQMRQLTAHVESNIGGKIAVAALAAVVHLSMSHFYRTFRASFGMTPQAYIVRQRILRAELLMRSSNEPLARIALDCGLCDQAHLSRTFRRVVGVTPNVWRRGARSEAQSAVKPT
jgi:AraC family transcriptional regulator